MTQVIQAGNLKLYEVEAKFHLHQRWDSQFFLEWQGELPDVSEFERQWLDQVKGDYLSVVKYTPHEEVVKMFVLSPLLSMAGLARYPFIPFAEHQVEISLENDDDNEDEIIRGKVDLLILHQQLWVVIIEAKRRSLNVAEALPQALFHMMASPNGEKSTFGLAINGTEFLFLKLVKQDPPQYGLSRLFSLFNPGNDLYTVLSVLKHLREIVTATTTS